MPQIALNGTKMKFLSIKEIDIIWAAIILVIISLLFPPFGYTKFTVSRIVLSPLISIEKHYDVPWTFVEHQFIYLEPPKFDQKLEDRFKSDDPKDSVSINYEDMKIAWHIVAIQVAIIILIASGLIFTLRSQKKGRMD